MEPSTELVMQALGEEEGFRIAATLIKDGPQRQSELARSAAVSPQRTSDQLRFMRALGLVERESSARGKWSMTDPASVAAIFASAAELAAKLAAARAASTEADRAGWDELALEPSEERDQTTGRDST
jgi:DNA-binding HxlR family transcriptional regulator